MFSIEDLGLTPQALCFRPLRGLAVVRAVRQCGRDARDPKSDLISERFQRLVLGWN